MPSPESSSSQLGGMKYPRTLGDGGIAVPKYAAPVIPGQHSTGECG